MRPCIMPSSKQKMLSKHLLFLSRPGLIPEAAFVSKRSPPRYKHRGLNKPTDSCSLSALPAIIQLRTLLCHIQPETRCSCPYPQGNPLPSGNGLGLVNKTSQPRCPVVPHENTKNSYFLFHQRSNYALRACPFSHLNSSFYRKISCQKATHPAVKDFF